MPACPSLTPSHPPPPPKPPCHAALLRSRGEGGAHGRTSSSLPPPTPGNVPEFPPPRLLSAPRVPQLSGHGPRRGGVGVGGLPRARGCSALDQIGRNDLVGRCGTPGAWRSGLVWCAPCAPFSAAVLRFGAGARPFFRGSPTLRCAQPHFGSRIPPPPPMAFKALKLESCASIQR